MADKLKYHFLTGDHSGKNPARTLEFDNDAAAIEEAKKSDDVIRVQSDKTLKHIWQRPAKAESAAPDKKGNGKGDDKGDGNK